MLYEKKQIFIIILLTIRELNILSEKYELKRNVSV